MVDNCYVAAALDTHHRVAVVAGDIVVRDIPCYVEDQEEDQEEVDTLTRIKHRYEIQVSHLHTPLVDVHICTSVRR